ncbi:MAG: hypothetical protein AB8G05_13300 [Oligoflexales bacterium]
MILLIGNENCPYIKKIHRRILDYHKSDCIWLTPFNLINDILIDDSIDASTGISIRWQYKGRVITPVNVELVINNVSYLPSDFFQDFVKEDRSYAEAEFVSYFLFALSQFKNILNKPHGGSLSGWTKSLPAQWIYVSNKFPGVDTPTWALSSGKNLPQWVIDENNNNLIANENLFNLRYWRVRDKPLQWVQDKDMLYYNRPAGVPIVINGVEENIFVDIDSPISSSELQDLLPINFLRDMATNYGLSLYHAVFFFDRDKNNLTFGSILPFLHLNDKKDFQLNNSIIDYLVTDTKK